MIEQDDSPLRLLVQYFFKNQEPCSMDESDYAAVIAGALPDLYKIRAGLDQSILLDQQGNEETLKTVQAGLDSAIYIMENAYQYGNKVAVDEARRVFDAVTRQLQ